MKRLSVIATAVALGTACNPFGGEAQGPASRPASDRAQIEIGPAPAPDQGDEEQGDGLRSADCDRVEPGPPVPEGECITAKIACGDTLVGHTLGGVDRFNTRFYERHHCTPATTDHDGGDERVYELEIPDGKWTANVTLRTPCANLSLAAIKYGGSGCPSIDSNVRQCEMWPKPGHKDEHVKLVSMGGARWLLVVEGQDDEEGAFELSVECHEGLN